MKIFVLNGKKQGVAKLNKKFNITLDGLQKDFMIVLYKSKEEMQYFEYANIQDFEPKIDANCVLILDSNLNLFASGGCFTVVNPLKIMQDFKQNFQIKNKEKEKLVNENQYYLQKTDNFEQDAKVSEKENKNALTCCEQNTETDVVIDKEIDVVEVLEEGEQELSNQEISFTENVIQDFYQQIKDNLFDFLNQYPKNEFLCEKVFNSDWVTVENGKNKYNVGVIFENSTPQIIAYAVEYENKNMVDESMINCGEWLIKHPDKPEENGYIVFYQNAQTGQMILE